MYGKNEFPPVAAAALLGQGRVIVDGGGATLRSSPTDHYGNSTLAGSKLGPLMVRWLINWEDPREHRFLYYWASDAFHTASKMSGWLNTIENELGFQLGLENGVTITTELLENYDVLHIIGTPRQFSSSEIQAIKSWVEAGGGLLLAEQSDYGGYSYPTYFNEILDGLGISVELQDDQLLDNDQNAKDPWYPRVYLLDPRSEDSRFDIWFPTHDLKTTVETTARSGYDEVVTFTFTITNTGTENTTYGVQVSEVTNYGWSYTIYPSENIILGAGENAEVTISVSIPETEESKLAEWTVKVTDQSQTFLSSTYTIKAYADVKLAPSKPLPLDIIGAIAAIVVAGLAGVVLSRRRAPARKPKRVKPRRAKKKAKR